MKLIIDIPEDLYKATINGLNAEEIWDLRVAIKNGTPLSESDDCISRQAAIDAIKKLHSIETEYDCTLYEKLDVLYELEDLPPVNPAEKVGRWKRVSMDKYVQHAMAYYRCSECGGDIIGEHNYCPNCGAKMQEVEE